MPVHLPVHASWLNQIEIYFSVLQRNGRWGCVKVVHSLLSHPLLMDLQERALSALKEEL